MTTIALSRRTAHHPLCHPDSKRVDFARVAAHINHLRSKQGVVVERDGEVAPAAAATTKATTTPTLFARVRQALTPSQSKGTVALIDRTDSLWHGPIQLGGRTIQVDFDTGSGDLVVNKSAYKPGATAKKLDQRFQVGFGDATKATGEVYTDTLLVAGIKTDGVAFGWADSDYIGPSEGDKGLAGMALMPMARLNQPPFFDAMIEAGVLKQNVFSFRLRHDKPTLTLGGIPDDVRIAPTYVDVDASQGFWASRGKLNGVDVTGIQDTGTTLIVAPVAIAKALFATLGLATYTDAGVLYATLPDATTPPPLIQVEFGLFKRTLTPETTTFGHDNDGKPVLSIAGADVNVDGSVLFGDAWLRNVVAVFSREDAQPKMGFVAQ